MIRAPAGRSLTEDSAISEREGEWKLTSAGPENTEAIGVFAGARLRPGDLLLLSGTLGTGKTCFARGLARGLDVSDPVASPTFALIQEYRRFDVSSGTPQRRRERPGFAHADLYRIASGADLAELGLEEYLDGRWILAVEWAERFPTLWPTTRLEITLADMGGDHRELRFSGRGADWESRLRDWKATLGNNPALAGRLSGFVAEDLAAPPTP